MVDHRTIGTDRHQSSQLEESVDVFGPEEKTCLSMEAIKGQFRRISATIQTYLEGIDLNQEHHHRISEEIGQQLSSEEILKHPEFAHVYWDLKPEKKERVDVASGRGGPLKLSYEIHGHGPRKLVV